MADLTSPEISALHQPSMQPLPLVYQPALASADRSASSAPAHNLKAGTLLQYSIAAILGAYDHGMPI